MISTYINFGTKLEDKHIGDVFNEIKTGSFKKEILAIRIAKQNNNKSLADNLKRKLLAFTPSGKFGNQRKKELIDSYSKIINLDFDHISIDKIQDLISVINECDYTYASFISPSGEGVKVFIKIDSGAEQHTQSYLHVANYYKDLTGHEFDEKCKDITRLCFVSYDENTYVNQNSKVFQASILNVPKENHTKDISLSSEEKLQNCLNYTEKKIQYINGNRNNFVYQFACNANKFGITKDETLNNCIDNFDLDEVEIENAVNSAYKNQIADFAKFANLANETSSIINDNLTNDENESFLLSTPKIPQSVYNNLPSLLKKGSDAFSEERAKDTFLTGALSIISGCLPNVTGLYSGREIYPHLYSFILAPAASGKGALQSAKELADKYHSETMKDSLKAIEDYKNEEEFDEIDESTNKESTQEPKFQVVHIPANTSNAKIIQHLQHNKGRGIICETEADTLGQTFKNDWGSYSDLLRKAFHHEKISISRKADGEYLEIEKPQLAVALSGTPKQVFNIISSAEDGLFSRFLFYTFKSESKWIDPSPYGQTLNLTEHFKGLSDEVYEMTKFFENNETTVSLSREQWNRLNEAFLGYLERINTFVGNDAQSVVKRLGLIQYRFCMILSALRKFDNKKLNKDIVCLDEDFDSAAALIKVYIEHSMIMYNNLPKQAEQGVFKKGSYKDDFFKALPTDFARKDAIDIGKNFNLSTRSIDGLLKKCIGTFLEQPKTGRYRKT